MNADDADQEKRKTLTTEDAERRIGTAKSQRLRAKS
jgi:hypothetical protein